MFIMNHKGERIEAEVGLEVYKAAKDANLTVAQHVNQLYMDTANPKYGSAFDQICASAGLVIPGKDNPFGQKSPLIADILSGETMAAANVEKKGDPFGTQSRTLFPAFVIGAIEDRMQPDRETDDRLFRALATTTVPINGDTYLQPLITYGGNGGPNTGPNAAKAGRVTQMGLPPTILMIGTSDKPRSLPTYGIGIEMSDKALKGTTLDLFTLTMNRFWQIEKDARVYSYMSNLFAGDLDQNSGAVPSVTSNSLDSAATGGVLTHRAWLKFLARKRRFRRITTLIADLDTYLKVEGRTGRPGSNNYDPTLERIDPQAKMINNTFGGNVEWILVDSAAEGGPVPANTIWAMDKSQAFMFVKNTEAEYNATEDFVLRRSKSLVWHWSEECIRLWGDQELSAFDVLVIS